MSNRMLVVIDGSYFMYYVLFGAVNQFQKKHPTEFNSLVKSPAETDQNSLPSLLVSDSFKRELKQSLMNRCKFIDVILQRNFQRELDEINSCSFIFAIDDYVSNSFRKKEYPEYKAQRKLTPKSYQTSDIKNYITNVLFPELDIFGRFGYHLLKVDGAEGDDVVAVLFEKFKSDFSLNVLFASDHDFCQISGIHQFDLRGIEVKPSVTICGNKIDIESKIALLMKIIMGDNSDNIPAIGERIGPVKAYKLASNRDSLKEYLVENRLAAKKFLLNKKIIDFKYIPTDLSEKIVTEGQKIFAEDLEVRKNTELDLSMQNVMEL